MKKRWVGCLSLAMLALALSSPCLSTPDSTKDTLPAKPAMSYPLTIDSLNKLLMAEGKLKSVMQRDANLERAIAMSGSDDALKGWLHRLEMKSEATDVIKAVGMTPREYLRVYVAVVQASAVAGLKQQGKDVPPNLEQAVPPENIAFVRSHVSEIAGLLNGKGAVKPNTIEDLYVASEASPQEPGKDASKGTTKTPADKTSRSTGTGAAAAVAPRGATGPTTDGDASNLASPSTSSGTLLVRVTDSAGVPLADGIVEVTNTLKGVVIQKRTDPSGEVRFALDAEPGYLAKLYKAGYATHVSERFKIAKGVTKTLVVPMPLAQVEPLATGR